MSGLMALQIMAAVLAANALSAWFGYSAWVITRIERNGGKPQDAPWSAFAGLLIPLFAAGVGFYFLS